MDAVSGGDLDRVQGSAREWHKLQLAALGFVGLCGVLKGDSGRDLPTWLQTTAGALALAGLGLAGLAVLLVAPVAWPVVAVPEKTETAARRLRTGILLTVAAVGVTALSTMGNWWPNDDAGDTVVRVTTADGQACGPILASGPGWIELDLDGDRVRVPLDQLVSLSPVDSC